MGQTIRQTMPFNGKQLANTPSLPTRLRAGEIMFSCHNHHTGGLQQCAIKFLNTRMEHVYV